MAHFDNPAFIPELSPAVRRKYTTADDNKIEPEVKNPVPADENVNPQYPDEKSPISKKFLFIIREHRGLWLAVLAALLFSFEDICLDVLTHRQSTYQTSAMFVLIPLIGSFVVSIVTKAKPPETPLNWLYLLICGLSFAVGLPLAVISLAYMDVADSIAIIFTMPIFAGVFGWIFLKEAMRIIDVVFALVSFAGVLLIARPPFIFGSEEEIDYDKFLIGVICALVSAVTFALCGVFARKLSIAGIQPITILYTNSVTSMLLVTLICSCTNGWSKTSWQDWGIALSGGVIDFIAQFSVWQAFTTERAVYVSIAGTTEVIFTFILQFAFFKLAPDWISVIGAACILSACVGLAFRSDDGSEGQNESPAVTADKKIQCDEESERDDATANNV